VQNYEVFEPIPTILPFFSPTRCDISLKVRQKRI